MYYNYEIELIQLQIRKKLHPFFSFKIKELHSILISSF